MSTKQKRKTKPRAPRKEKAKVPVRKRKVAEERRKEVVTEKKPEKEAVEVPEKPLLLAVRILGSFGTPTRIETSLRSLKLGRKFRAVLLNKNESMVGALRKVKDYVTWGEVGSHDIAALLKKRGELSDGMAFTDKFVKENLGHESLEELAKALTRGQVELKTLHQKGVQPVFRLRPPSGGFESSIKRPFGSRGELGYRGTEISHLLERMM
jgi:large subunit ribosomal protein L30